MLDLTLAVTDQLTAVAAAAAESGDDEINGIAYLFLSLGFVYFGLMFLRYRNIGKRHHHESETASAKADIRARDDFVRTLTGLKNSRMRGANETSVRGSLNKLNNFF